MKYSRNPESGIMEEYNDDGVYVGNVITLGDVLMSKGTAQDGGPGSGNFNHEGRPGKVGGSAPKGEGGGNGPESGNEPVRIKIEPKTDTVSAVNKRLAEVKKEIGELADKQGPVLREWFRLNGELVGLGEGTEEYEEAIKKINEANKQNEAIQKRLNELIEEDKSLEKKKVDLEEADDTPESVDKLIDQKRDEAADLEIQYRDYERQYDEIISAMARLDLNDPEKVEKAKELAVPMKEALDGKDRVQNELYEANKAIDELKARRNRALKRNEQREIEASGKSESEWRDDKAREEFGTTDNFYETGWILLNGDKLDFSGWGDGRRHHDHRDIAQIYAGAGEYGTREMRRFRNDGNIRFYPEVPGINLTASANSMPTDAQLKTIAEAVKTIARKEGQFCIDFSDSEGNMYGHLEYTTDPDEIDEDTQKLSVREVMKDLKAHLMTGEITEEFGRPTFSGDASAQDGGPGSGNWGHAGRPGKVGGSQKGGGGQYRGGKAEVGYFGSRRDWLNGLSGDRQYKAVRFIAQKKREFNDAIEIAGFAKKAVENGKKTQEEADEILEKYGVKGLSQDSPIELYILQNGGEDADKLIQYAKEARDWPKNKERLMNANLTEEERKIYDYIDEANSDLYPDVFRSLFAKALGIPHKDSEIPDELLYESGVKERPEEKPDYDWWWKKEKVGSGMAGHMGHVVGEQVWGKRLNQEEFMVLNKKFVDTMKYEKLSPVKCREALNAIDGLCNVYGARKDERNNWYRPDYPEITKEMADRLDSDEYDRLLSLINWAHLKDRFSLDDTYDRLEDVPPDGYFKTLDALKKLPLRTAKEWNSVRTYVLGMEKMLVNEKPSEDDPVEAMKKEKKLAEEERHADFVAARDAEQKEFVASGGPAKKKAIVEKLSKITPESVNRMSRDEIARLVDDAKLFREGSQFVTSDGVYEGTYPMAVLAYKNVVEKFPFLAGELGGFGDNLRNHGNANAGCDKDAFDVRETEIKINYNIYNDEEKIRKYHKDGEAAGWYVKTDPDLPPGYADITHELGHSLANWLHRYAFGEFRGKVVSDNGWITRKTFDNEVAIILKRKTLAAMKISGYDAIKREVSEYAAASRTNKGAKEAKSNTLADEFFAECFCELMCSSNPRPVVKEFGRQLDKFIKEHKITADCSATTKSTMPHMV